MVKPVTSMELLEKGLPTENAGQITATINEWLGLPAHEAWHMLTSNLLTPALPFSLHLFLFEKIYPDWLEHPESAPAWEATPQAIAKTHLMQFMREQNHHDVSSFHQWTTKDYPQFWQKMIEKLQIQFSQTPHTLCDLGESIESPYWLPGAKLNIIESCFTANPDSIALTYLDEGDLQKLTYQELNNYSNRIANSLIATGFKPGDAIAIAMPMTVEAIAIYLGIIKMGGVVVAIADSFSSEEIALRLQIANAQGIFTQNEIVRDDKTFPLYSKITAAHAPKTTVLTAPKTRVATLRRDDLHWQDFLLTDINFNPHQSTAMTPINILFSSGTTGTPKAIPWNHTTAIKAASDAYLHQDIHAHDILAWPTNLGWMMGPWLIFAALINQASIAVYADTPNTHAFGEFIQNANVTMLGVVPTLVASWRQSGCMENLDWRRIKCFSSTGECSNAEDMLYLMSRANYCPVIEYCGGTEIGGSYLTGTLIQKNYPALFSTPAMGSDLVIIDEAGKLADHGEVALIPPAMGLSTELLNANHHEIYFANMPEPVTGTVLRRHGDQIKRYSNGYYSIQGRVDDTMNLSGIKISAAEIERALAGLTGIVETAAIAVPPLNNGPAHLVIFAVYTDQLDKTQITSAMQTRINQHLSPLFKIYDIVFVSELPKTPSNKIMRRMLRKQYQV